MHLNDAQAEVKNDEALERDNSVKLMEYMLFSREATPTAAELLSSEECTSRTLVR